MLFQMSADNYDNNKAVRRATVCLRCPEETAYQDPKYLVMFYILINHVELTQEQFYSLVCGNKAT